MEIFNTDLPTFIGRFSMSKLINELSAIEDNEILMPWYSYGGDVWSGFDFADFLKDGGKEITAKVTGVAASMGAALLPYFKKVIGAKQSNIMIHSVSSDVEFLRKNKNEELYQVLSSKINEEKFEKIKSVKLKDIMFSEGGNRRDVWLSGQEAFDVELFDELIDLSPEETLKNELMLNEFRLTANLSYELPKSLQNKTEIINETKTKCMKIDELKTSHPKLYAEVFAEGESSGLKSGVEAEKERVNAWMVFNDVDPEKVKAGIESGKGMTKAEELSFLRNSQKLEMQKSLENSSAGSISADKNTGKPKTEAEKEDAKLDNALDELGIKEEDK
jgi:ATP-dependent protease ClpP protease subunit